MGIRFFCPNGHKLNVKSFQAGRRGICPFCGAKIVIPSQSTRKSTKSQRSAPHQEGNEQEIVLQADSGQQPGPGGEHFVSSPQPEAARPLPTPEAMPVSTPVQTSPSPTATSGDSPPTPTPASNPQQMQPATHTIAGADRAPASTGTVAVYPAQSSQVQPVPQSGVGEQPPTTAPAEPPATERPTDPLDEAANIVWYVRPPSGGQFGPATSDVMRTWIGEGRVSTDSLVWREGWRDWRLAAEVFPQLGADDRPFEFDVLGSGGAVSKTGLNAVRPPRSRRQETVRQASIITLLVLAVLALAGVFVWVLVYYPAL